MSIRLRLALLFGAAALVLLIGGGALFVTRLEHGLDQSLTLTLRTRADNISSQLSAARRPRTAAAYPPNGFHLGANGTWVQLLTSSGRLIAGSHGLAPQPLLNPGQARLAHHRTIVFDRSVRLARAAEGHRTEAMRVLARRLGPSGDLLAVAVSREVVDQAVSGARHQLVLLGVVVIALAGVGSWLLTRAALRPVERMRIEVRDLQASRAGAGLQVPKTGDEIARLAETFNVVLARMHAAVTREQALVADAGHELRTPLTVLKGELELARRPNRSREELAEAVEVAAEETERLVRLTEDLLFLSREESDELPALPTQRFDLVATTHRAVDAMAGRASRRGVRIVIEPDAEVWCTGNPEWIRRAVDNLLANALRHAPLGSLVTVRIAEAAGRVRLSVADEGAGFPPEFLPHAFDRFSRADNSRVRAGTDPADDGGSGLGLAIVRTIVTRHGGTATAANRPEGGAEVVLEWPAG